MGYLISETTKEERKKLAKIALGISIFDNAIPSRETINLIKQYINGDIELEQAKVKIIRRYKNE